MTTETRKISRTAADSNTDRQLPIRSKGGVTLRVCNATLDEPTSGGYRLDLPDRPVPFEGDLGGLPLRSK